jgi:hypothetical protein
MDGSLVSCGLATPPEGGFKGSADDDEEEVEEEEVLEEEEELEEASEEKVSSSVFGLRSAGWLALIELPVEVPAARGESCSVESVLSGIACNDGRD